MSATANPDAERALIGAALITPDAIDAAMGIVEAADFAGATHQVVWAAIVERHLAGDRVEALSLAASIRGIDVTVEYLHGLVLDTPATSAAAQYARMIAEARVRARLVLAGSEIVSLGQGDREIAEVTDQARRLVANIDMPAQLGAPAPDVRTFTDGVDTRHRWLLPGFLERGDRLLVTAAEGAGKSLLLTQIAMMAAAGIHPWTWRPIPPVNVTLVDLENGERMITRRLSKLLSRAPAGFDPARLRIITQQRGINLTTAVDRRWLTERCIANETELLVIGPAYRMSSGVGAKGDIGGEDMAKTVTDALDDIRARCDITLILETHAPHAGTNGRDLRPFGSSVWLRWPEFGIGLRRDKDQLSRFHVDHWRGPRDVRTWPKYLDQNGETWPWVPFMPHVVPDPYPSGGDDPFTDDRLFGGPA